jgi:hypothetical protein
MRRVALRYADPLILMSRTAMATVFGAEWNDLTPEIVETFLADAREESLTWEAKGHDQPRPDSIRKHVCGFANQIGGYLIIGAERREGEWSLPGVVFRDAEPEKWLEDVIRGLQPSPPCRAAAWPRPADRHLAVIEIGRVAGAPCMTPGGMVYERVSGATLPVRDPAALARLFARGEQARAAARDAAWSAVEDLLGSPPVGALREAAFALALTHLGRPDDAAVRPFRESAYARLENDVDSGLQPDPSVRLHPWATVDQEGLTFALPEPRLLERTTVGVWTPDYRWAARVTRSTTAAVWFAVEGRESTLNSICQNAIPRAWDFAATQLEALGGFGPVCFALRLNPTNPCVESVTGREIAVERWLSTPVGTHADREGVIREAMRAAGRLALEPDASSGEPSA